MVYLILVNVSLLLCYALYSIFLKKLTFFQLNRIYLLGAVIVSLLIPIGLFIDMPRGFIAEEALPHIDLHLFIDEEMLLAEQADRAASMQDILQIVYWIGAGLALLWLCFRCSRVLALLRSGKSTFSFAFFRTVVLADQVLDNKVIAEHEQIHVAQGHSYDLVFVELVRVFNWFNPVLRLYLKELKFQHECIADEQSSVDRVAYAELLVAQAMQVERSHFLHEFSEKSLLKNRIAMLFKDKTQNKYKFLYLSIAPVLGLTLLSTLVFNSSNAKSMVRDIENKVEQTTLNDLKEINFDVANNKDADASTVGESGEPKRTQQDSIYTNPQVKPQVMNAASIKVLLDEWANAVKISADAAASQAVVFRILVERDGRVSRAFATTKVGDQEKEIPADQLVASKWKPARDNGKAVRSWTTVYTSFDKNNDQQKVASKAVLIEASSKYTAQQQDSIRAKAMENERKIFTATEVNPEPVGGLAQFRKWIGDNYSYPQAAIDAELKGQMVIYFIVEADGELSNFKVIKDLGHGTGEAALDVLRKATNWKPGIQNGRTVRVAYTLPITLNLERDKKG